MKYITLVVAMAKNGAIGLAGQMPWHLPADLGHFKKTTWGKAIIMGRKTFQSIGKALPGRQNIVVTRNQEFTAEGCTLAESLENAISAAESDEVMVIGGGQIYREALEIADRMVVTEVDCEPEADTWLPEWDKSTWLEVGRRSFAADAGNPFAYSIVEYLRMPAA
jgi:dihydrofolate reductase